MTAAVLALSIAACASPARPMPDPAHQVVVRDVRQLARAVDTATAQTTIVLEDGVYALDRTLDISAPHVVLRGRNGDPSRVVLRGAGMTEGSVGVAVSISASYVTIADVTIGWVGYHGVQIRGEKGASHVVLDHVRIFDTGQQLLKGSVSTNGQYADDGLIACSEFGYTDHAPSDYTNGVDILAGRRWTVRDNRFERIRGPESARYAAGPAILFWADSADTVVEGNVVVDSFRGIAFGLGPGASTLARDGERVLDHAGGRIRNNVVVNLHEWADEGIEVNSAGQVAIERNTVLTGGRLGWGISVRFPASDAIVRNNLTTRTIITRNGGHARLDGNIESADLGWFADPANADVRLVHAPREALHAGIELSDAR